MLGALLPICFILVAFSLFVGFHKIEEGHVGVYYIAGKLSS